MMPWHRERGRGYLGIAALVVLAIASIVFSVWGMQGFRWPDFLGDSKKGAHVTMLSVLDCPECASVDSFVEEIKNQGIAVQQQRTVDAASLAGKKLIETYKITKVPTVLIQGAAGENTSFLEQFGDTAADGMFVLRDVLPPYKEVATNTIKGRFGAIYLTDKSCKDCYDVALHKSPLERLGMKPSDEKTFDVADKEGKELVKKYTIETVPTLLLQGELSEYASLNAVWSQVGTIEPDGTYVFRTSQDSMGTYRILKTGEIKKPAVE